MDNPYHKPHRNVVMSHGALEIDISHVDQSNMNMNSLIYLPTVLTSNSEYGL